MSIKIIQKRLESYQCRSAQEEDHALREITQEVVLAGLSRTDFFSEAAFQGGTCLRIFHGLDRFSEDLDFILKKTDPVFSLEKYLKSISMELEAYGYRTEVVDRSSVDSAVKKAFIKDGSLGKVLELRHLKADRSMSKIRIKVEADTNPPAGSVFEQQFVDFPFGGMVSVQNMPSLFAGKIHALLCREYVKGRDWYDFIWYTGRKTAINYQFLSSAMDQTGPWAGRGEVVDLKWCHDELCRKISMLDWAAARKDVARFLKDNEQPSLELWGAEFFLRRADKLLDIGNGSNAPAR